MTAKLEIVPKLEDERDVITIDGRASRELMATIALGALQGAVTYLKARQEGTPTHDPPTARPFATTESDRDVMTADEVAAFLGVDRNTVYDYTGHRRILAMLGARGKTVAKTQATETEVKRSA